MTDRVRIWWLYFWSTKDGVRMKGIITESKSEHKIDRKRQKEIDMVSEMIQLYCKRKHKNLYHNGILCDECQELMDYSIARTTRCPFMESKTFCSNCKVHCYSSDMREKIRDVMKFSGPRMMLVHPVICIWHVITSSAEKLKRK